MNRSDIEVQRANADDLSRLSSLWEKGHLDTVDLSKRFIEFQILLGPDDSIIACFGFRVAANQAFLHSVCIDDEENTDLIQILIWERLESLLNNHGIHALWSTPVNDIWEPKKLSKPPLKTLKNALKSGGKPGMNGCIFNSGNPMSHSSMPTRSSF